FDGGRGKIRARRSGRECGDVQALACRAVPVVRIRRVLERNAPSRKILRKPTPRREVQLVGFLELRQVTFQARTLRQQPEDPPLVEAVNRILPDHVVDGAQLAAVTDQQRRKACEAISHHPASGSGTETANPARKTGCGKPSGATSGAAPRGAALAHTTDPSD